MAPPIRTVVWATALVVAGGVLTLGRHLGISPLPSVTQVVDIVQRH
jgi:hypothetical protein